LSVGAVFTTEAFEGAFFAVEKLRVFFTPVKSSTEANDASAAATRDTVRIGFGFRFENDEISALLLDEEDLIFLKK
jgi:hypothetical protein